MSNPIINQNQSASPKNLDINALKAQFIQDPLGFLVRNKLNIPQSLAGDFRGMVEYLANTGQVPPQLQAQVNVMLGKR